MSVSIRGQSDHQTFQLSSPTVVMPAPESEIFLVQPRDYTIGTGDTLYVVDERGRLVHAFSLDGDHLFQFGGDGRGPGELRAPRRIAQCDGRIFTLDVSLQRINEYSSTGEFIRAITLNRNTYDIVVDQDYIYTSTSWFTGAPVTRISRASPDDRVPLLETASQFFPEVEMGDFYSMGMRGGSIYLSIVDDQLIAVFRTVGVVAVLSTGQGSAEPRFIRLEHHLIDRYIREFQKRLREYEGPGSITPSVVYEATPWPGGGLACLIRTFDEQEYEDVRLVLFDLETGTESGVVKTPDIIISTISMIRPGLAAGIDSDSATILLCTVRH
ncbi:6-bladed beta-propeller [Gemmatimonadota bacterium]